MSALIRTENNLIGRGQITYILFRKETIKNDPCLKGRTPNNPDEEGQI